MGKFYKMVDLSTDEKKKSFFELLDSKKSMQEVYKEFDLKYTPNNSSDLKMLAKEVGFDLFIYKERQSKPKKYCLRCGSELTGSQNKFCSSSCAATYNNLRRKPRTEESKKRTSNSIKLHYDNFGRKSKNGKQCKICGEYDCKHEFCKKYKLAINVLINKFGFNPSILRTGIDNVLNEYNRIRQELYELYWIKQMSSLDIIKKYNKFKCTEFSLLHMLRIMEIPIRSHSDSTTLAYLNGNLNQTAVIHGFKSQWHTTWDNKEVYLRSSYEFEYAKQLDEQKIIYEVEGLKIKYFDTIKNKYRCAIPDFYLEKDNMIVEIKSSFTYDKQNMLDRFKAYKDNGYNYKMIMDGVEYFEYNLPETYYMTIKNCFKN